MFHKAGFAKFAGLIGLSVLSLLVISSGTACAPKAGTPGAPAAEAAAGAEQPQDVGIHIKIGENEVSGTVKNALGNYFFMADLPGFDIAVTGPVSGGDATSLIGKLVRIKGVFNKDLPNLLVAQSIEIKESELQYTNVYTSADASAPADFFNQTTRSEYPALALTRIDKSEDWEGKGKGKVHGKLVPGAEGKTPLISVLGADDKEIGKIVVDSQSSYANYYIQKIRLFEKTWFYLNIKESVARNLRARNKEMFHADIVYVGLY